MSPRATVEATTRAWLENAVIGLNLCPFARQPYASGQVQLQVSAASSWVSLQDDIEQALETLSQAAQPETLLLIVPKLLQDFNDYLDALAAVESLIEHSGLEGIIQVASFHPQYCFEGEAPEHPSHFTNRAPYPIFHFLREASLEAALAKYPKPERIPAQNIEKMQQLSTEQLKALFPHCFGPVSP